MASFQGTGFQQSGSGSVHVGGDLNIATTHNDDQLARLQATNPRHDKKRIEDAKGGLLAGSYEWILGQRDFVQWRNHDSTRVLLIKGDAGKGKTMLLCGAINELTKGRSQSHATAYFFCEATDSRTNNSESVLRGLIHMLLEQRPELGTHLPSRPVPDDCNAWFALSEIFVNILEDSRIEQIVLFIDALNECDESQRYPRILDTICQTTDNPRVKWLLTSRHNDEIEENLTEAASQSTLCLELKDNAVEVARAVRHYIKESLAAVRALQGDEQLSSNVRSMMEEKSQDTFLWVSLVVQELKLLRPRHKGRALGIVDQTPKGLHSLYERMARKIEGLESDDTLLCRDVLLRMLTAFRPLQLVELGTMIQHSPEDTVEIVRLCGSFLTVPDEALPLSKRTVYVVHHSAQTYLRGASFLDYQGCSPNMDRSLFVEALSSMQKGLKQDFYGLNNPGVSIVVFNPRRPDPDPLAGFRYYCEYWVHHFSKIPNQRPADSDETSEQDRIESFLTKRLLFWIEALSFLENLPQGLDGLRALKVSLEICTGTHHLVALADDAISYLVKHLAMIQKYPLQTYAAGLIFSPKTSITRQNFSALSPNWVSLAFGEEDSWTTNITAMQAVEEIRFMAFSGNDKLLACISSKDFLISPAYLQIWNVETGHLSHQRAFEENITGIDISYDGNFLILFSSWRWCYYPVTSSSQFSGWRRLRPIKEPLPDFYGEPVLDCDDPEGISYKGYWVKRSYKLSPDLLLLATCHETEPQKICLTGTENGQVHNIMECTDLPISFGFLNRGQWFAAATSPQRKGLIKVWDLGSSSTIETITTPDLGQMFTFPESTYLMTVSVGGPTQARCYRMWDSSKGTNLWSKTFAANHDIGGNILLSPDCNFLVLLGASSSGCYIVDVPTGSILFDIPVYELSPSPNHALGYARPDQCLNFFNASISNGGSLLIPRFAYDEHHYWDLEETWVINISSGKYLNPSCQATLAKHGADRWAIALPHGLVEIMDVKDYIKIHRTQSSRPHDLHLFLDGQLQATPCEGQLQHRDAVTKSAETRIKRLIDGSCLIPLPHDKRLSMDIHSHTRKTLMEDTAEVLLHGDRLHGSNVAYSSDGSILTFQSWSQSDLSKSQCSLTLWDSKTGRSIGPMDNPPNSRGDVKPVPLFAPGNRIAVTDLVNTIYIWDQGLGQWILRLPTKLKEPIESVVIDWTTVRFVSHHMVFTRPIPIKGAKPKPSTMYGIDCSGEWLTRGSKREIRLPFKAVAQTDVPFSDGSCKASRRAVAVVPGTIATTSYTYCPVVFNVHND